MAPAPPFGVRRCNRLTGAPADAGPRLTPLDQSPLPRHKTRHENGYLHYLPEDYSLARSLAWPFSSPKDPR